MTEENTDHKNSQKCQRALMKELSEQIKGSRRSMLESVRTKVSAANVCLDDVSCNLQIKEMPEPSSFKVDFVKKKDNVQ